LNAGSQTKTNIKTAITTDITYAPRTHTFSWDQVQPVDFSMKSAMQSIPM